MKAHGIHIVCIQESHRFSSEYFCTPEGFLCIFSGSTSAEEKNSDAGVGFIIAPEFRPSVVGFCQASDRLCALRLRVQGGKIGLISAYAPQSGRAYEERRDFFNQLSSLWGSISINGPVYIFGDLNSRLYRRLVTEEGRIGDHYYQAS